MILVLGLRPLRWPVFAGRPFEIAVLHDTVQSVRLFDTGDVVPGPYTFWPPTINGLFD